MWCFMDHDGVFSPSSAMFCRAITFRVFFLCSEYIETTRIKSPSVVFLLFFKAALFSSAKQCLSMQGCFILRTYICSIVVALTYYMSISINRKGGGVSFWKTKNIKTEEQKSVYPRLSSIADSVPHACAKIFWLPWITQIFSLTIKCHMWFAVCITKNAMWRFFLRSDLRVWKFFLCIWLKEIKVVFKCGHPGRTDVATTGGH